MNISPAQSREILVVEPLIYSSGVEDDLSSLEDLERYSNQLHPTAQFPAGSTALSPTPSTSTSPSTYAAPSPPSPPSPEPPMTLRTTPCRPRAKRRKITDPVNDQFLEAVKVLTDLLKKEKKDDFCVSFGKNMECWLRSFSPDMRWTVVHKINMVVGELAIKYGVRL
ncbi:uncharacterized protein LOC122247218 [Penaeus japonicus]|uniref:uncharacterized protein LOC122247218 n=1 Tax=Penaeus japonicus TaxID=27405 RepID=UPI001C714F38|nr:uncharacterized protein LOC122247218 [Penaeus japonicus]